MITDDWLNGVEIEAREEIRSGRHSGTLAPCDVLSLVSAHRAALARIAELEAKSAADLADYETSLETMERVYAAKLDRLDGIDGAACAAIRDMLNEFGALPSAFIDDAVINGLMHARRQALEEAARVAAEFINLRLYVPKFPACSYHAEECAIAIRSLMDKEPGQ